MVRIPRGGATDHGDVLEAIRLQGDRHVDALKQLVAVQAEARHAQEDDSKVGEGTMNSLRGASRWLVYLGRGCDTFDVAICEGLLGRDLHDGLKRAGDAARTLLTQAGFPVPISNRVAFGLAACAWGGRDADHAPDWSMTAADFPWCTEETLSLIHISEPTRPY